MNVGGGLEVFHTGIRVPVLEQAMSELTEAFGVVWAVPRDVPNQPVWTPDGGSREVKLRFTYSATGPHHLELVEGEPGSPWHGDDAPGVHHMGTWVDDVATQAAQLIGQGWQAVAAHRDPADGYGWFVYLESPSGVVIELVDRVLAPMFERWWADALG